MFVVSALLQHIFNCKWSIDWFALDVIRLIAINRKWIFECMRVPFAHFSEVWGDGTHAHCSTDKDPTTHNSRNNIFGSGHYIIRSCNDIYSNANSECRMIRHECVQKKSHVFSCPEHTHTGSQFDERASETLPNVYDSMNTTVLCSCILYRYCAVRRNDDRVQWKSCWTTALRFKMSWDGKSTNHKMPSVISNSIII